MNVRRSANRRWALLGFALSMALVASRPAAAQFWGFDLPRPGRSNQAAAGAAESHVPHPAIVRVIVDERTSLSHGTGVLVAAHDQHALVLTNWHVVRDMAGPVNVIFPSGFMSPAKVAKVDKNWDLAALGIWNPNINPIPIAKSPPRIGEPLTIAGYGSGQYRALTGRCTQFVAPGGRMPNEMVEVNVEARFGDSGGPILNQRGEVAGILFGASRGTTTGSHAGRVRNFLAPWIAIVDQPPSTVIANNAPATAPTPPTATSTTAAVPPIAAGQPSTIATSPPAASPFAMPASTAPLLPQAVQRDPIASSTRLAPIPTTERPLPVSSTNPSTPFATRPINSTGDLNASPWSIPADESVATANRAGPWNGSALFNHARNALAIVGVLAVAFTLFGRRKQDE